MSSDDMKPNNSYSGTVTGSVTVNGGDFKLVEPTRYIPDLRILDFKVSAEVETRVETVESHGFTCVQVKYGPISVDGRPHTCSFPVAYKIDPIEARRDAARVLRELADALEVE